MLDSADLTLDNSFTKELACAAINPSLRSILIFDAPYVGLETTVAILTKMLEVTTRRQVKQVSLGASDLDDDLWGNLVLSSKSNSIIVWHQGPLAELWNDSQLRLVIIPDLTKLSLAAARACVILMGADVAHLERHGQHQRWQPNICWLAACPSNEVGSISPHLLDRFALRMKWPDPGRLDRVADLLDHILKDKPLEEPTKVHLPSNLEERIQKASQYNPIFTDEALARVIDYTSAKQFYLPRREFALARLARSLAQLDGINQVTAFDVDAAAHLIGLTQETQQREPLQKPRPEEVLDTPPTKESKKTEPTTSHPDIEGSMILPTQTETTYSMESVYEPDHTLESEKIVLPTDSYPEDAAPVEREIASLRLPWFRFTTTSSVQGTIIGIERATGLRDLALISTLFAAAPFQLIRRKHQQMDNGRLLLAATDLRSYRREPAAEQLLLILLDYTSLGDCDWQSALLPYLSWAYVERANIGIIQVGMKNATHEFRAELVSARSILVPSIAASLEEKQLKRGRATPLAHGFDLALHTLQHALQHGRSRIEQALFVVISDGRGNVPLEASYKRAVIGQINREGIDDTLQVARYIRNLKNVQATLFNPQPKYYPELPRTLAEALGAEIVNIKRLRE